MFVLLPSGLGRLQCLSVRFVVSSPNNTTQMMKKRFPMGRVQWPKVTERGSFARCQGGGGVPVFFYEPRTHVNSIDFFSDSYFFYDHRGVPAAKKNANKHCFCLYLKPHATLIPLSRFPFPRPTGAWRGPTRRSRCPSPSASWTTGPSSRCAPNQPPTIRRLIPMP